MFFVISRKGGLFTIRTTGIPFFTSLAKSEEEFGEVRIEPESPMEKTTAIAFWDLIEGDESSFSSREVLYQALSDPQAKVENFYVTKDNMMFLEVARKNKSATFFFEVFGGRGDTLKEIIELVKKRTPVFARMLAGAWMDTLKEDEKIRRMAEL